MRTTTAAPILCVRDLLASCELYERAFGFERMRYFDGNGEYAVMQRAAAQIHLFQSTTVHPHHTQGPHVADAFVWVDDLIPILSSAQGAGLTSTRGPEHYDSTPVATTEVVFPDLDENWICFGQADEP